MARQTLAETMNRLQLLIQAGTPVIYLVTHEEARAIEYIARIMCRLRRDNQKKNLYRWTAAEGHQLLQAKWPPPPENGAAWSQIDIPSLGRDAWRVTPVRKAEIDFDNIRRQEQAGDPNIADSLTIFLDIHRDLHRGGSLVRPLRNVATGLRHYYETQRATAKSNERGARTFIYKSVIIVAPTANELSSELERDVVVMELPLPGADELCQTLDRLCTSTKDKPAVLTTNVTEDALKKLQEMIAGAGRGLTLEEFKLGLNDFAVRGGALSATHIDDMLLRKGRVVTDQALTYTPNVEVELRGVDTMVNWVNKRKDAVLYQSIRDTYRLPALKGVLLCGVSGGGKSQLAKYIAKQFGLALLRLDVGALFGSYVGESEEKTRRALRLAEILSPIVLWLDEVDKAFSGVGGGGDSGVSARVFGTFLTWLSDKEDNVFVVATANDFRQLLGKFPEFGRKGRFDQIFWLPLPSQAARQDIFELYLKGTKDSQLFGNHFHISLENIRELAVTEGVDVNNDDPLKAFAELLSNNALSANMTGAEIEQAIKEALYAMYDLSRTEDKLPNMLDGMAVGQQVIEAVKSGMASAVYRAGSAAAADLMVLEGEASANYWPFVS